jgi:hypothetical protein
VGLIPVWGIIPKVAVSYAGTYVVGHAILQWYLTGRHLSPKQLRGLYVQAFAKGKEAARRALEKVSRPRSKHQKDKELPAAPDAPALPEGESAEVAGESEMATESISLEPAVIVPPQSVKKLPKKEKKPLFGRRKKQSSLVVRSCLQCGKSNAEDASFCQYCGTRLTL